MPDYDKIFNYLSKIVKEKQLNLFKFDLFCDILRIPEDIKLIARDLLINQRDKFNSLRSREKFLIYIASFFVSYVIQKSQYEDLEKGINQLLEVFDNNPIFVTKYVDLNRMFLVIRVKGYHPYLLTNSLSEEQKETFISNIYKIEIIKFYEKINEYIDLSVFSININDLIAPILFIIKKCNKNYENVRKSRYSAALYFLLSNMKKLQKIDIEVNPFYRLLQLSRRTFYDHLDRINTFLDYDSFMNKFPNLGLIEKKSEEHFDSNQKSTPSKFNIYRKRIKEFRRK